MNQEDNAFFRYLMNDNLIQYNDNFKKICILVKIYHYIKYIIKYYQTDRLKYLKKYFLNINFNIFHAIIDHDKTSRYLSNYHILSIDYYHQNKINKSKYYIKKIILYDHSYIASDLLKIYSSLCNKENIYLKYYTDKKNYILFFIIKKIFLYYIK